MSYCPLISYQKQYCTEMTCMGEDCILWDSNKDNCLVRLSLLKCSNGVNEVSREDELEAQIKILKQQLQGVSMGFPMMNLGNTIDKD